MTLLATNFKRLAGVPISAVPLLAFVGIVAIVGTSPAFFASGQRLDAVPILDPVFNVLQRLAEIFLKVYASEAFYSTFPRAIGISVLLLALVPLAALVSSTRSKSWEPFITVLLTLALSVLSVPLLAWTVVLIRGLWRLGWWAWDWWSRITSNISESISGSGQLIGRALLILTFVAWVIALVKSPSVRRWSLWVVIGAIAVWALFFLFRLQDTAVVEGAVHWLSQAWGLVISGIGWLVGWTLRILLFAAGLIVLLGLLGQIGSLFWTPFASSWGAGGRRAHTADFVAGAGVSMSIILMAAVVNPDFRDWFYTGLTSTPGASVIPHVVGALETIYPSSMLSVTTEFLRAVSGFPEFVLIILTCFIGSMSLVFSSSAKREDDGLGGVVTLSLARTTIATILAIPTLVVLWWLSRAE